MQVNSLWLISSVASKWAREIFRGTIYFAVDGTLCSDVIYQEKSLNMIIHLSKLYVYAT